MQLRGRCYSGIGVLLLTLLILFIGPLIDGAQGNADTAGTATPAGSMSLVPLHPKVNPALADTAGYIAPTAQFLATIFHTEEERQGAATGNHVVIDAGADQQLQVGDQFTVFRTSSTVRHPVSDQNVGTLMAPLGYATAVHVQPLATVLKLTKTFDAIKTGDKVQKFEAAQNWVTKVAFTSADREIRGVIVATKDNKASVGEEDIVYIDQGKQAGVRIGDQFNVYLEGDTVQHPTTRLPIRLPRQVLGELSVLDVRDHTATAVVTYSRRELAAGAPVALHASLRIVETKPDTSLDAMAQLQNLLAQVTPCLQASREALRAAETAGATEAELASAKTALASAEQQVEQAKTFLSQGNTEQARLHLDIALEDCLSAKDLSQQARIVAEGRSAKPEQYTVQRGDTLWGISAQEAIYNNSLMWPLIYKANRDQIRDPDLIFPKQNVVIPRSYSQEEADTAIQRARKRRSWRLGDGPDMYILEGIQQ